MKARIIVCAVFLILCVVAIVAFKALVIRSQHSETTGFTALGYDPDGIPTEILNNTEYAAPEAPSQKGLRRGNVFVGRCDLRGVWTRPALALPPCNTSWTFPVRAVVTRGIYVRERVNGGLQVGALELGDVVTVRELHVVDMAPLAGLLLGAEIDFPAERGFRLVRP